jgi:hypothetical protein
MSENRFKLSHSSLTYILILQIFKWIGLILYFDCKVNPFAKDSNRVSFCCQHFGNDLEKAEQLFVTELQFDRK